MSHPEDLLAEYVDGTLAENERAVLDAHLAGCARCREEVEAAARAVSALASLEEEPVPLGVTGPVLAEARRSAPSAAPRRRPLWERYQWAGGLAAAAALLLLVAVLVPQLTGRSADDSAGSGTTGATAEAGAAEDATLGAPEAVELEVLDEDLDDRDLERIAKDAAAVAPSLPQREVSATSRAADPAIACLLESGMTIDDRDVLVRVIEASYLGTPAYVGVFHEGPGGGEPADKILVWVVSKPGCSLLTGLSQRI